MLSDKCKVLLEKGINEEVCNVKSVKMTYVLCRYRQLESEGKDKREALKQAWKEVKEKCKTATVTL
jgi:hypothetical protein